MFEKTERERDRNFFISFFSYLWSNFDDKGYSLWTTDYLDYNENQQMWITSNLMNGTAKSFEDDNTICKYVFGVLNVYAKDDETPPFKINGACIMRGVEALGGLGPDNVPLGMGRSAESFKWTRLDFNNNDHRKKFEELFCSKSFGNEQVLDRRFYK